MICGLKSFPLAVVLEDNEKLVETEFGIKGFTVMVKLWQAISAHGYYMKWDIDTQLLFISDYHLDTVGRGCVSEIVTCCVRRGVFDTELYEKYQILTSKRSQETFLNATKRKEKVVMDERYCLPIVYTFIETASKKGKIVNIFFKNADNSEQTKLNKTKLNEIKDKEVSKKVSSKKEEIESYDEIFENMETDKRLKSAVIDFIRHLKTSYGIVMLNGRLIDLLIKLDLKYQKDEQAKCKEVRRAIVNGYKRLECEEVY